MWTGNRERLRITGKKFNGEQLVLENYQGIVSECVFTNGRTTLRGKRTSIARRSIYTQIDGAGVLVTGKTDLIFRNCVFRDNQSIMCGGAVSLQCRPGSKVTFERCLFEANTADDTGPAIDLLTPGMRVYVKGCTFRHNRSTGRWTSKPVGQITIFPGNQLIVESSKFSGNDVDMDYHETNRKVDIATDRMYKIVNTSGVLNNKHLTKVAANVRAYLGHPLHYPWV